MGKYCDLVASSTTKILDEDFRPEVVHAPDPTLKDCSSSVVPPAKSFMTISLTVAMDVICSSTLELSATAKDTGGGGLHPVKYDKENICE